MKTVVIFAHPIFEISRINKRWIEELEKYPEEFTVHNLYKVYPNEQIDIKSEQKLIESHGNVIFQFPIFWFNCPPLLKKWFDNILVDGWAYGASGNKFSNRNVALIVTAGITKEDYTKEGRLGFTLDEILLPFKMICKYINAKYQGFYAFYGVERNPSDSEIEESVAKYIDYIRSI